MLKSDRQRAFTLIELLVVIAIVAIIAAILFPVFAQAKVSAKQTQCIMHTRQVGLATLMYRDDNDDMWVPAYDRTYLGTGFRPQHPWIGYDNRNAGNIGGFYGDMQAPATNKPVVGKIDPYMKNHAVRVCPMTPSDWQMAIAYNFWTPAYNSSYYNRNPRARGNEYGPGTKDCDTDFGYWDCRAVNDSEIEEHSNTLVTWEHGAWAPVCVFLQTWDWFESPPNQQSLIEHFHFLHREGAIVNWADGHTKRMTYFQLKRPMFSVRKDIYQ